MYMFDTCFVHMNSDIVSFTISTIWLNCISRVLFKHYNVYPWQKLATGNCSSSWSFDFIIIIWSYLNRHLLPSALCHRGIQENERENKRKIDNLHDNEWEKKGWGVGGGRERQKRREDKKEAQITWTGCSHHWWPWSSCLISLPSPLSPQKEHARTQKPNNYNNTYTPKRTCFAIVCKSH